MILSRSFSGIPIKITNDYHLWLIQMNNDYKEKLEVISTAAITHTNFPLNLTDSVFIVTYKISK